MKKLTLFLLLITSTLQAQFQLHQFSATYDEPMTIHVMDNYMMVSEKDGKLWIADFVNGDYIKRPEPIIDIGSGNLSIIEEVNSFGEQGFLDFTPSPNYETDTTIYLYYTCNNRFIDQELVENLGTQLGTSVRESISRVTKYTLDIENNSSTRGDVIIGDTFSDGILIKSNHVGGSLNFMSDGTLLVTTGDGGFGIIKSNAVALGIIDDLDFAEQGSYLSSMGAMQLNSCNGKVLRIDTDGNGVNDNPFYDSQNPRKCKSRVYNVGLRNPFRARIKNDSLFINNVGEANWESIFISDNSALNFGWQMKEGFMDSNSGSSINFETGLAFNETFDDEANELSEDDNLRVWQWKKPELTYHQNNFDIQYYDNGLVTEESLLYGTSISGNLPITSNFYGLQNKYMFSDFYSGIIATLEGNNLDILNIEQIGISDIKEINTGEIFMCSLITGKIYRLDQDTLSILESEISDLKPLKTEYFDLSGKLIKSLEYASKGVYLERKTYRNNIIITNKINN